MRRMRWLHSLAIFVATLPAATLVVGALRDELGANPIETVTHVTGEWALRFLLLSLAVTPLRRLFGWHQLIRLRRTAGLFAFGYATAHLATFIGLDHFFEWEAISEDIFERPWVTVGGLAWLGMLPLAATSTRASIRRLGRRWVVLHRLVYISAACAILHYLWQVKADLLPPLVHGGVLAVLLALRWVPPRRSQRARA
jgi:sulfoxide reductase heme-binding subunit YedZ